MRKRKIWLFIIMLILFVAALVIAIGLMRGYKYCAWEDSIERRLMLDDSIYELLNLDGERLCIRTLTKEGVVTGYYELPKSTQSGMYTSYHTIGFIGTELYLYSYEATGDTPNRRNEMIIGYDMQSMAHRIVAHVPSPDTTAEYDVFYAQNTAGKAAYIGYLETQSKQLTLNRVAAASGDIELLPEMHVPFPLSSISVAETGEFFALAMDSRIYMRDGEDWTLLYVPGDGEAVANMTIGTAGEVYAFIVSDNGTHAIVSTAQDRQFSPLGIDTEGIIKIHVASPDRWVGLDNLHRYVLCINGVRYTIDTLVSPISTILSMNFPRNTIIAAIAATLIHSLILFAIVNKRLHLLPKLLLIIIPVFSLGIFSLVSIAEQSVKKSVENGLRNSIIEYAYEIMADLDAERFASIDWNNPFEDEYYVELHSRMNELSVYRVMDVLDEQVKDSHNAYISCWMYRVTQGRVYTAIGGHYATGLEMKYFSYSANDIRREDARQYTEPLCAIIGGADSNIRYKAVLFPLFFKGDIVGYLEVARPMTAVDAAVYGLRQGIIRAGIIVFASVITTLVLVLVFSTATLSKLKRGALDISGGDYSSRVKSNAWDETGEIASAFNKMAQSVQMSVKEITNVSDGYKRFVPDKLVELLDKTSISALRPGDHKNLTGTNILLYTDSFDKLRDGELFDGLSRFYNLVLPCIASADGLMTQHSPRGLSAMFKKPPEAVLRAMFELFDSLDKSSEAQCHVFMSYSRAMLGVTGNEDRLNMIAVSRLIYESYDVGVAGMRFGTRLIVAQNMHDEMGEAAQAYNHRFLGYLRNENRLIRLYDFYDCDTPPIKVKKHELKEQFEKGVELYYEKQYSKARRIFVEIIKEFPDDTASREYLRRSHAGLETTGEPLPIIELK